MNHSISQTLLHQLRQYLNIIQRSRHHHDSGEMNAHHGQGRIIFLLLENEGISQRVLAELMQIRPGSLSELLTKLEQSDYIERRPNERDRRVVNIFLKEEGLKAVERVKSARQKMGDSLFAALTAEEQSQLSGLLEKLISSSECQYASDEGGKAFGDQPHRGHRRQRENHSGNLGRRSFSLGKQSVSGCPIFEERSRRAGLSEQNCQLSQQELGEKESFTPDDNQ